MTLLYFGSFNPIHNGHLAVAQYVLSEGLAEEVWLIVSPQNPHKQQADLAPEEQRLEMARRAVENIEGVKVCDVEFELPRPSYTIDTLDHLRSVHPDREFALLGGGDVAASIHTWKEAARLLSENRVFIYPRGENESFGEPFIMLPKAPKMSHSSTQIRELIAAGRDEWKNLVPEVVAEYVAENDMYVNNDKEEALSKGKEAFARSEFGEAINHFEEARRLNGECEEAMQWLEMIEDILAFRHKDYYNP